MIKSLTTKRMVAHFPWPVLQHTSPEWCRQLHGASLLRSADMRRSCLQGICYIVIVFQENRSDKFRRFNSYYTAWANQLRMPPACFLLDQWVSPNKESAITLNYSVIKAFMFERIKEDINCVFEYRKHKHPFSKNPYCAVYRPQAIEVRAAPL